jgi:hypothetical protein
MNFTEKLVIALCVFASGCAAYGAMKVFDLLDRLLIYWQEGMMPRPDATSSIGALAAWPMFFFVFFFMLRGIEDWHNDRIKKEVEHRMLLMSLRKEAETTNPDSPPTEDAPPSA